MAGSLASRDSLLVYIARLTCRRLNHGGFLFPFCRFVSCADCTTLALARGPGPFSVRRVSDKPQWRRSGKAWRMFICTFSSRSMDEGGRHGQKTDLGGVVGVRRASGRWDYITWRDKGMGKLKVALPSGFLLYLLISYSCAPGRIVTGVSWTRMVKR
jgi:hypothetical protein